MGLAVRDSNVSLGSVLSRTCFSLSIYEIKKYILPQNLMCLFALGVTDFFSPLYQTVFLDSVTGN